MSISNYNRSIFNFSIYNLKPKFQNALRPFTRFLFQLGVSANQVTIVACLGSVVLGLGLFFVGHPSVFFVVIPIWLFFRMALNAIDGMLAREFNQKSVIGAYLNELTDVISDAALYLPFACIPTFDGFQIGLLIWLAGLSELAGVLGQVYAASRNYQGPMGKSDRALIFGVLGLWVGILGQLPNWMYWVMWCVILLIVLTIIRRVHQGLYQNRQVTLGFDV